MGIVLGEASGLVRVDVDGPGGEEILAEFSNGDLPTTLEFTSGRENGGRGLLYAVPPGLKLKTTTIRDEEKQELRFQANGAQTVMPPSRHPDGAVYSWKEGRSPAELRPALMPAWLITRLQETEKPVHRNGFTVDSATLAAAQSRARAYIAKMPPAISGQGGHDQTFAVACALILGFNLSIEQAFPLLQEYNDRCDPPWTEAELRHKLEDADRQPGERGYKLHDDAHLTDRGNAMRVVQRHGQDLRFCHPWKRWLCWDQQRWIPDVTAKTTWSIKETQRSLYKQVSARIRELGDTDDPDKKIELEKQKSLLNHLLKWEDHRRITNCLDSMKSEPGIPILPADLNSDHFLFNAQNGTLDLRTGDVHAPRRTDFITKISPVQIDLEATCPTWDRFLDRIFAGNTALIEYLQRVVGYSLTGDVSEQCLWFFHGAGANGKSTFLGAILALFGDYGMQSVSELLMERRHDAHPTERADLFGKRFVCTIETEQGKRMAESLMKQMTGGDKMRARKMREDFFEFTPTHKLFLAANHKPVVKGTDHAVWRRIKMVPFSVTIPDHEKDKNLLSKLLSELPGILTRALTGCLAWRLYGLNEPKSITDATAAYQADQDKLGEFLAECTAKISGTHIRAGALREAFINYCGEVITTSEFSERMSAKLFNSVVSTGGYKVYKDLALVKVSTDSS